MHKKCIQLLILSGLCFVFSCKENTSKTASVTVPFKKEGVLSIKKSDSDSIIKTLDIEIADNDYEIQTGLMYRNRMEDFQAMLFMFPNETPRSFYMKNTRIPLDIIFIAADSSIVSFQKNAKPFDETSLPSNVPAKYVLEINGGLSDTWELNVGDRIDFKTFK